MPNPLSCVTPALGLLGQSCSILPATGTAVEELLHPDRDEVEDILINRGAEEVTAFAETPEPSILDLYRPAPPLHRSEQHLFRFFIDGSLRTYHLATGIEGNRSFPIQLAQIGGAVVERKDDGSVRLLRSRNKVLLLVPVGGRGLSSTVWQRLLRLATPDKFFEPIDVAEPDVISGERERPDLRDKAGGKARHRMHRLEIDLIDVTKGRRNQENWVILDGAVKLDEFINVPHLIGVTKSFRKDPQFYFGRRASERKDVTAILAALPHEHRTVAFAAHGGQVAFWYVRLREQKDLDYPLMGVIKVELPTPDRSPVPADLIDLLSRALVAERNVTPYGRDRRWHCHLYPIFIAEQAIKNQFYSQEVLLGAIRWPKQEEK
ncbi:MAG: hypothetical protein GTN93_30610 [Anaerolineae bacterium]|nr:hypothetical protein [Anaerolineae bacterium]